jgi:hypothetical protein
VNCGIFTAAIILSLNWKLTSLYFIQLSLFIGNVWTPSLNWNLHFKSNARVFFTDESPAVVSHRELTHTDCNLLYSSRWFSVYNLLSDTQETYFQQCFYCCVTSLRNRGGHVTPPPLFHNPSVYTCRLATGTCLPQRCVASFAARLGTARRIHRFVYCCVIAVFTRGKYATVCKAQRTATYTNRLNTHSASTVANVTNAWNFSSTLPPYPPS